jgi:two-component system sensor histidine kinase UhpB
MPPRRPKPCLAPLSRQGFGPAAGSARLAAMSLRARLLAVICLALLVSFATATGLAAWRDARLVRNEVSAALETSRQTALFTVASLTRDAGAQPSPPQNQAAAMLTRFVASFDASRHVQAVLLGPAGTTSAVSRPAAPAYPPPRWFMATIAPRLPAVRIDLPTSSGFSALLLVPHPDSEVGERWVETRDSVALLGLLSLLTGVLCWVTVAHGLRPLRTLATGLARLGVGDRALRLKQAGPPEVAALAKSFNQMAAALATAEHQNRRLQSQLLRVAEEERADVARDLHDEVGPLLFAITTYVATMERLADAASAHGIAEQLSSVRESVAMLQAAVRGMLHRLRDVEPDDQPASATAPAPEHLAAALDRLLQFWRGLRPETRFDLAATIDAARLTEPQQAALLRVAQEAVSNAVRHGKPAQVTVELTMTNGAAVLRVADDGIGGEEGRGYGLPGMRERLAALGGALEVRRDQGWTLTASAPVA